MTASLTAVCVLHALVDGPEGAGSTAIDKRPVAGAVEVGALGLAGDRVVDTRRHGGPEQAVYVYADEDAARWAAELDQEVPPGRFGENLRTTGLDVSGAEIGERWRVGGGGPGSVLLQVTAPRIPCSTFAHRMGVPGWVGRFSERRAPGAYVAVLEPGVLRAGDGIVVESRPGHGVSVADAFLRPDPADMHRLLDASSSGSFDLTPKMREYVTRAARRAPDG